MRPTRFRRFAQGRWAGRGIRARGAVKGGLLRAAGCSFTAVFGVPAVVSPVAEEFGKLTSMADAKPRVLVVYENPESSRALERTLDESGFEAVAARRGDEALELVESFEPDVALVDLKTDVDEGTRFIARARAVRAEMAVVGVTEAEPSEAIRGVLSGADAIIRDDVRGADIAPFVERAVEKARATREAEELRLRAEGTLALGNFGRIVGNHPSMQDLLKRVAYVARTRATVLIQGESGTGKELIAAALHQNSRRADYPFVCVNCAALAESVLESELFGHERGAFTGATSRREGRFMRADKGTLFLDEISEVPPSIQVKLLRFLQEREFERVGSNETHRVDTRIVAATNRDLAALVEDGKFREDLYYRLAVVKLEVPPLRARPSDIVVLAEYFLRKIAAENDLPATGFTDAAQRALLDYTWPGNVRELQNVVEQAVVMTRGPLVDVTEISIRAPKRGDGLRLMIPGATLAEVERYAILETLRAVGGSPSKAAHVLGISRRTIQYRLKEYGVSVKISGKRDA